MHDSFADHRLDPKKPQNQFQGYPIISDQISRDGLDVVWPRLAKGGTVLIDDYRRETLPGVEKAIRDFFHGSPPPVRAEHNIAIIFKT